MNILILTPDGVGSTILQRIVTLGLCLKKLNVINSHELTNGLEIKNKLIHKNFNLGYSQTLEQIIEILKQVDHFLVSRVAKYHIDFRKDTSPSTTKFYKFLNNFYQKIIFCKRRNIFEYALSWSIRQKSGVLNIFNKWSREKVLNVSQVNVDFFKKKCQEYTNYIKWVENNFDTNVEVYYEDFVENTDFILDSFLQTGNLYKEKFGNSLSNILKIEYDISTKKISYEDKKTLMPVLKYRGFCGELENQKILPFGIASPIKNTTLSDKKSLVKNYDDCKLVFYKFARNHNWIDTTLIDYDFWNKKNI